MPQEQDYINGLHSYLKENFGEGFKLSTDEFKNKLSTDSAYANQLHGYLKENFGDDFKLSTDEFQNKVGYKIPNVKKKETTIPVGGQPFALGGESTPQLPLTSQSKLVEKFDYSKSIDRANAISSDIEKINAELGKHKKTIDFYQKDYLKNQGYNDLSIKGQTLKSELEKFDINGFNKNLDKAKTELVEMENKVKDYDRLINEKNQLPESVFENYQKDLALYKNKVNDYNNIVNDPEYQKYFKGSNELHDIYVKQNDIAKNLKTNPEYQQALAKYNEGVIKIKGGINEFNKISADLKSYHTLKAKENYDKGLAQIKKLNPANKVSLYNNTLANINKRFNQNMLLAQQAKEQGDDLTLQKLQPILDADVNKMKILEKGASAQKTIAALQEDNSLGNNLGIGIQMALGGLGTGMKGIDNAITTLQRDAFVAATGYDFTDDTKKKLDDFISKQNTSFPKGLSEEVYKISKPILDKANERSQIQDVSKKYNGSGFEALLNGDFGTAVEYGIKDFSKSLPSSLTYMTPITAALTSGGMVGEEIDQAKAEKDIATSADVFAGIFKAGLELATERMFGAGRASRELIAKLGKTKAEQAVMNSTKEVVEKTLRQKLGKMYSEEIVGEITNQIGSNAVDKYIHGKDVSLTDGVGNAGWIALFGAGTQGTLAETYSHNIDRKATAKADELKGQATALMDEALHQENPTAAEAIERHADKLNEEAQVIENKQKEIVEKATPETLNAIQEVNAKIDDLTASIESVSEEAKPILEQQIVELENQHEELIKQAEKEVSETENTPNKEVTDENIVTPQLAESSGVDVAGVEPDVVEENVFYHGTPTKNVESLINANNIDLAKFGSEGAKNRAVNGLLGKGLYLTNSKEVAKQFGDVLKVTLKKDILNASDFNKTKEKMRDWYEGYINQKRAKNNAKPFSKEKANEYFDSFDNQYDEEFVQALNDYAKEKGYGGVKHNDDITVIWDDSIIDKIEKNIDEEQTPITQTKDEKSSNEVDNEKELQSKFEANNKEAESLGFTNAPHAIKSINKRLGTDYKTFEEIPKEDLAKVAEQRKSERVEAINTKEERVEKTEENVQKNKEGFTEGKELNKIYANVKAKYGEKQGTKLYEVANRLVNPNKNTIIEIRSNGVVVKEGDKYMLLPFGNTDANSKKWTLYKGIDISNQYQQTTKPNTENAIQEQSTSSEVSHNGETRENKSESSKGVRPSEQGEKVTEQSKEEVAPKKPKVKEANVKAIEEALKVKSETIKSEVIKEAANPTDVAKVIKNLDYIKSKLAGLTDENGNSIFSEECNWR